MSRRCGGRGRDSVERWRPAALVVAIEGSFACQHLPGGHAEGELDPQLRCRFPPPVPGSCTWAFQRPGRAESSGFAQVGDAIGLSRGAGNPGSQTEVDDLASAHGRPKRRSPVCARRSGPTRRAAIASSRFSRRVRISARTLSDRRPSRRGSRRQRTPSRGSVSFEDADPQIALLLG